MLSDIITTENSGKACPETNQTSKNQTSDILSSGAEINQTSKNQTSDILSSGAETNQTSKNQTSDILPIFAD